MLQQKISSWSSEHKRQFSRIYDEIQSCKSKHTKLILMIKNLHIFLTLTLLKPQAGPGSKCLVRCNHSNAAPITCNRTPDLHIKSDFAEHTMQIGMFEIFLWNDETAGILSVGKVCQLRYGCYVHVWKDSILAPPSPPPQTLSLNIWFSISNPNRPMPERDDNKIIEIYLFHSNFYSFALVSD